MSDLISRQDAIDAIEKLDIPEDMCVFEILSHIELASGTLPSAECNRGEWIVLYDEDSPQDGIWKCSNCGYIRFVDDITPSNYCPNCGTDMRDNND